MPDSYSPMAAAQAVVEESCSFVCTSQLCLCKYQVLFVTFRAIFICALLRALCIFSCHHLNIGVELVPELRSCFGSCRYLYLRQEDICIPCKLSGQGGSRNRPNWLWLTDPQQSHLTELSTDTGSVSPQSSQNWIAIAPIVERNVFQVAFRYRINSGQGKVSTIRVKEKYLRLCREKIVLRIGGDPAISR